MSASDLTAGEQSRGDDTPSSLGEAEWRALAARSLKGGETLDSLVSHTDDGIAIEPLYPRAAGAALRARGNGERRWKIITRIDDTDPARANAQALHDIDNGADGIALVFEGAPNAFGYGLPAGPDVLAEVLRDVPLERIHLRADAHPGNRTTAERLLAFLGRRGVDPARLDLSLGIDPASVFAGTGRLRMSLEALEASMPQSLAHFFTLGVPAILLEADGRVFHNAGATEAQELAVALASAVSYLRQFERARQPLVYAVPHIGFCLSVDQDQLMGIAKLRALRTLWARVAESCSLPPKPVRIHAETSWRMLTARDPETNIVRNTLACFTAATGGADSLAVLPHTQALGLPEAEARRLARSMQLVLGEESHLGFVADPARGAGALEALTDRLCEAAWNEFRCIEGEGGVLPSLAAGLIQARIAEARAARAARIASGEKSIVGTTLFPPPNERPVSLLPADPRPMPTEGAVFCERLELLRDDSLPMPEPEFEADPAEA